MISYRPRTFAFEGDGRIEAHIGGYKDWLRRRKTPVAATTPGSDESRREAQPNAVER
jgi:hypothetical protein